MANIITIIIDLYFKYLKGVDIEYTKNFTFEDKGFVLNVIGINEKIEFEITLVGFATNQCNIRPMDFEQLSTYIYEVCRGLSYNEDLQEKYQK